MCFNVSVYRMKKARRKIMKTLKFRKELSELILKNKKQLLGEYLMIKILKREIGYSFGFGKQKKYLPRQELQR